MITVVLIPQVASNAGNKKKPGYMFSLAIYLDEFLFKSYSELFPNIFTACKAAEEIILTHWLEPSQVYTIIENFNLVSELKENRLTFVGLPYSVKLNSRGKYEVTEK
jgi:hypothetical protein